MSMQAMVQNPEQSSFHSKLLSYSLGNDNDYILACIITSWQFGESALPDWLGLGKKTLYELIDHHFPGYDSAWLVNPNVSPDNNRLDERDELLQLLTSHRAGIYPAELWLAEIVVSACQGQDHLWQDLGLWSRKDLSLLMMKNFPTLAGQNDKDMKWKKFLYKQLCIAEGIYTCRAPSCQVCVDYAQCFGPEE